MPFFSFRRDRSAKPTAAAASTESVEVVRKRARQRLIGASVLVLIAVVGFPLIFDSQPRPVPVDIAIEIPSRSAVKPGTPIAAPTPAPAPAPASSAPAAAEPAAPAEPSKSAQPSPQPSAVPAPASLQEREEIVSKKAAPPAAAPAADPPAPAPRTEAGRAQNLLEGKSEPAAAPAVRVVVQVGAFADPAKAREARQKLEKAGIKTYTQVVDTKEGQRTRVRAGPFPTREEAEQVAAKIRALDLPASIRTL